MPGKLAAPSEYPTAFSDLADMWNRLDTFANWKYKHGPCTGKEMAMSGFYYTSQTSAKCYYCEKELDNWVANDVPHLEHRRHSPECPYMIKFPMIPKKVTLRDMLILERDRMTYLIRQRRQAMSPWSSQNL